MQTVSYSRELEVRGAYDVLVAGSGPAGICAAVAAAREGAKVALIERYGVVGGNLTTGYICILLTKQALFCILHGINWLVNGVIVF